MKSVNPYLNFNGNTEEAFQFYQSVFGGELQVVRFRDMEDKMGATGDDLEKIANVALPIGAGTVLYGSDVLESLGHTHKAGNDFTINLEPESIEKSEQLFDALSDGGEIDMPLNEVEWAERFGGLTDKFGIKWMVNYPGSKG